MGKQTLILLVLCVLILPVAAQEQVTERPKVGLVLSGGGAKGLAHIGALKIIEESGVQIDYIGGTSMGAIVGALYASGYKAAELDSIFRSIDFEKLIQDEVPRGVKTFYEKEDTERYALTLPFDGFKVSFPQGISGGQNIYNLLARLLYHVKDVDDFNALPIPFLCIVTDVETGEGLVVNKGYLPEVILASGTFPSLFEPIEIDGRLLIDGGVINNYPIDEIRAKGADVIIGVDVQHGLSTREDLGSAPEILLQINNFRTVEDMKLKSQKTDIYIKPEIDDYTVVDFAKGAEIILRGDEGGQKQIPALQALAQAQGNPILPPRGVQNRDSLRIDFLELEGNENYSRGYVKGKLRFKLGDTISFGKLHEGLNLLTATGKFKSVKHYIKSEGDYEVMRLKFVEEPTKFFLKVGVHYDDLYKTAGLINLTKNNLFFADDVFSFDFILGDNIRFNLDYYVDKGSYWSYGFKSKYTSFRSDIDYNVLAKVAETSDNPNIRTISIDAEDWTNQFYFQTALKEEFALRLGVEHKYLKYSSNTLRSEIENGNTDGEDEKAVFENSQYFSAFGSVTLDTYDDRYFPTQGFYFHGDFHAYLFSSDYRDNFESHSIAQGVFGAAFPLAGNLYMNLSTGTGLRLGGGEFSAFDFLLGGYGNDFINNMLPFYGYDFLSLTGNSYIGANGRLDFEFAPKHHALLVGNIANVGDDMFKSGEWFSFPEYSGYGFGYGFESIIGPIQVFYTTSPETKDSQVFFSIGYWF
jgi:NTE family protein